MMRSGLHRGKGGENRNDCGELHVGDEFPSVNACNFIGLPAISCPRREINSLLSKGRGSVLEKE